MLTSQLCRRARHVARRVVVATAQPGRGIPENGLSSAARAMQDVPERRLPRWVFRGFSNCFGSSFAGRLQT